MILLVQFLLRLSFGLATGMAITSPREVTSGFYRNHLYVTLGLMTFATMVAWGLPTASFWMPVVAAVASYIGAVFWLYEAKRMGRLCLIVVAVSSLVGAWLSQPVIDATGLQAILPRVHVVTSGLVLGLTMAAMLLGHWYLNSPTMELRPLRMLIGVLAVVLAVHLVVCCIGIGSEIAVRSATGQGGADGWWWEMFILLRVLFGFVGVGCLVWMGWRTLAIPNTQSATGILYIAVLGTFAGELASLLLSAEASFPL